MHIWRHIECLKNGINMDKITIPSPNKYVKCIFCALQLVLSSLQDFWTAPKGQQSKTSSNSLHTTQGDMGNKSRVKPSSVTM